MSRTLETLLMLCRCLELSQEGGTEIQGLPSNRDEWRAVIDLANHQCVTPALWAALEERDATDNLPEDARDFLEEVCRLNRERNLRIRDQGVELFGALNREGITPLLLKGGAYLFDGNESALKARMMVDLDVLVKESDLPATLEVAENLGYRTHEAFNDWAHDIKCQPRPGDPAAIEFHRFLGPQRTLLPPETALDQAVPVETDSIRLFIPSLTHRVLHNIFHAQVQNRGHALGRISLRDLHDLGLLLQTKGQGIDWKAIQIAMASHGYGRALDSYLYAGERLMKLPVPAMEFRTRHAERHFERSLRLVQSARLRRLMSLYGSLSHPFSRQFVEYLYGPSRSIAGLNWKRARHAYLMLRRHHYKSLSKALEIRGLFYK